MDLHLDPVGGAAGDMFIAALLSAFPELEGEMLASIRRAAPEACCEIFDHHDGVLQGRRFDVHLGGGSNAGVSDHSEDDSDHHHHPHEPERRDHRHGASTHDHDHRSWSSIRAHLETCGLAPRVLRRAIAIFTLLAQAEGRVHGVAPERVAFHEVGAWDSIADIVGAAHLIEALDAKRWTVGPLPLGAGRVRTAHGLMPVPAPATALLMEGMATMDDGIPGERVTPTGAAILKHLCAGPHADRTPRTLLRSGVGFGAKRLPGASNCLRVLVFEPAACRGEAIGVIDRGHRELEVIEFEVDDQSAEDLAVGLERLRAEHGVLDVVQSPVFGKKGRMMTAVRLLASPERVEPVMAAVFRETTTIGLRRRGVAGVALPRTFREVEAEGCRLRVKVVERPGGRTAKAESDDALGHVGHTRRAALRALAERRALDDSSLEAGEPDAGFLEREVAL